MVRIFGIGIGLFFMAIIWPSALLFCLISNRAKPPVSTIGVIVLIVVTTLTIISILIPRTSDGENAAEVTDKQGFSKRDPDWMSILRPLIIIINLLALVFGLIIIYNKYICKQITRPKLSELKLKTVKPFVKKVSEKS